MSYLFNDFNAENRMLIGLRYSGILQQVLLMENMWFSTMTWTMGYSLQQLSLFEHHELEKLIYSDRWDDDVLSRAEQLLQELPDDVLSRYRRSRVISGDLNQNDARSRQSMNDILQSQVLTTLEAAGRNDEVCTRMWKHIEKLALEGNVALEGQVL